MRIGSSIEVLSADARPRAAANERAQDASATGCRDDTRARNATHRLQATARDDHEASAKSAQAARATAPADHDRVELSARNPLKPEENRPVGPGLPTDIDLAKVNEVREAIREGRFPVNAAAVADRLIESAADLVMLAAHPRH